MLYEITSDFKLFYQIEFVWNFQHQISVSFPLPFEESKVKIKLTKGDYKNVDYQKRFTILIKTWMLFEEILEKVMF